jgi:hypothetical protein
MLWVRKIAVIAPAAQRQGMGKLSRNNAHVRRGRLRFFLAMLPAVLLVAPAAHGQLRVVTYNTATGNPSPGVQTARPDMDIVLTAIGEESINGIFRPVDVLLLQEQYSNAVSTQSFVDLLNGIYGTVEAPTPYARGNLNALPTARAAARPLSTTPRRCS